MKHLIFLLIPLLLITACENPETSETPQQTTTSKCDSYSEEYNIIRCKAIEAQDISMCDPITKYATRETCIQIIAEMVQDDSQLEDCSLSKNSDYEITCRALVSKDVNKCFGIKESISNPSDIAMRDCIDLVARKLRDKSVCQSFITHSQDLFDACGGATSDCEGQWIDGAPYNVEDCEAAIDEAMAS